MPRSVVGSPTNPESKIPEPRSRPSRDEDVCFTLEPDIPPRDHAPQRSPIASSGELLSRIFDAGPGAGIDRRLIGSRACATALTARAESAGPAKLKVTARPPDYCID